MIPIIYRKPSLNVLLIWHTSKSRHFHQFFNSNVHLLSQFHIDTVPVQLELECFVGHTQCYVNLSTRVVVIVLHVSIRKQLLEGNDIYMDEQLNPDKIDINSTTRDVFIEFSCNINLNRKKARRSMEVATFLDINEYCMQASIF